MEPNQNQEDLPANLYLQPKFCPAGSGWRWITDAFAMFKVNWLIWIVMILIWIAIMLISSMLPLVNMIASVFGPIFTGGMMLGAAAQDEGKDLRVTHLFDGFKEPLRPLFTLGVLYLLGFFLAMMVTGLLMVLLLGGDSAQQMMQGMEQGIHPDAASASIAMLLAPLLMMLLVLPLVMALWFSPALVVFHKMPAFDAMKLSVSACLANMLPFTLYGLMAILLGIVAAIPFFLGFLVFFPMMFISQYLSYKEVFFIKGSL